MDERVKLTIEIQNGQPVELVDLTKSFLALAEEYKKHAERQHFDVTGGDVKLYVKEVRTGSIIADLMAQSPTMLPFLENVHSIITFVEYIKQITEYLLGKQHGKKEIEKSTLQNVIQLVEPISKDCNSQISIGAFNLNNVNAAVTININSLEANAIQNAAHREIDLLKTPETGVRTQVLLYWFQARNDPNTNTGDRAIIESISTSPVKVQFISEGVKGKILRENLFDTAYIVDVAVETINGRPMLYKILELHDKMEIPPRNEII
jgi:hypothetical protein